MSENKITATQTGTLFYTKIADGAGSFRVRFKSFNLLTLQNRERQAGLEQMQSEYNQFKYGRSKSRKDGLNFLRKESIPKLNKNMKDRLKDGLELKTRLKSMRETRNDLLERIKSMKE